MLPSTEGMAWIEREPLAYIRLNVQSIAHQRIEERREAFGPGGRRRVPAWRNAECSADMLSMMKIIDVAAREIDRRAVGGLVHGREAAAAIPPE